MLRETQEPSPSAAPTSTTAHGNPDEPSTASAPVLEVFASIQGEGAFVGEPQVFLRLAGCPLRCQWCDTPASWEVRDDASWLTPFQAATRISAAEEGILRTISVTGGEPLLWPKFIHALRAFVGDRRIHLETAGADPRALERVLAVVDHVSLDLKLARDLAQPVPPAVGESSLVPSDAAEWSRVREEVLELVAERDACAKIIVAGAREPREFLPLLDDVRKIAPKLPIVLQPVTPMHGVSAPSRDTIETLVELALVRELRVRVLPQVHRLLRVR